VIGPDAVIALFRDLEIAELTAWVEAGWVQPERAGGGWVFHEIDVARVRLIYDLRREFAASEETVPVVLSLLDQVYELRCTLNAVLAAIRDQPPEVQQAVRAALAQATEPG
jgi:chaperone modulatory protein CbpM